MDLKLRDKPDVDKAKNIVCALIHFSGGRFEGNTRLNKAFWRAHVYHYRRKSGLLSKYPIARLPEGPAIDDLDSILVVLEREGRIELHDQPKGKHVETVIVLKSKPPLLEQDEEESIKDAIAWVKNKTASRVRDESHALSLAWQDARNGDIIDLSFDALNAAELQSIKKERARISKNVAWATSLIGGEFGK